MTPTIGAARAASVETATYRSGRHLGNERRRFLAADGLLVSRIIATSIPLPPHRRWFTHLH